MRKENTITVYVGREQSSVAMRRNPSSAKTAIFRSKPFLGRSGPPPLRETKPPHKASLRSTQGTVKTATKGEEIQTRVVGQPFDRTGKCSC